MTCALLAALLLLADAPPSDRGAPTPRTDVYGDPLPPGAVARLGTIRLRHADADVTFSADGKRLISCGPDGEVRVWDAATGRQLRKKRLSWRPPGTERMETVELSPDGATAAGWDGDVVYLFDINTGEERGWLPRISPPRRDLFVLTYSPDSKFLAVQASGSGRAFTTQIWDVATVKKRQTLTAPLDVRLSSIAFTWDAKHLAGIAEKDDVAGKPGDVLSDLFLWDVATGKLIRKRENLRQIDADSLAFSPDGKTLAVAGLPEGVRLLETTSWKEKARLKPPANTSPDSLNRLTFSPDGRWLTATYGVNQNRGPARHGVFLWDLAGATGVRRLAGRSTYFSLRLAFAPDGKTLACHDESGGEIRLWDVATAQPLHQRPGHDRPVQALAASPDGKIVVSGDADGMLRLWDAATGKPLRMIKVHRKVTFCLFSPDGKRVISTGQTGTFDETVTFQVWDVVTGKELRRFEIDSWVSKVYAIGISADGKCLAAAASVEWHPAKPQLFVWDLATGKQLRKRPYKVKVDVHVYFDGRSSTWFEAHTAFAPNGDSVSVWLGERVGLEEVATGRLLVTLPEGVGRPMVFSPDGRLLAATRSQPKNDPSQGDDVKGLTLLEAATGEEVFRLKIGAFKHAAFTPDGRGVVVADEKSLRVWDMIAGEQLHQRAWPESAANGEVCSLAVLPAGRAATGMANGDILLWDLAPLTWPIRKPVRDPSREELHALWSDLASDARKAHRALHMLAVTPKQAVPFLRDRLQPAVALDVKRVEKLLADLDGDSFPARETATRELVQLRDWAEPIMRRALEGRPSLEMRRRLQAILAEPNRPSTEALRTLRAIAALERIGTPEARRVLEKLSGGAAARETNEAKAALQRLKRLTD